MPDARSPNYDASKASSNHLDLFGALVVAAFHAEMAFQLKGSYPGVLMLLFLVAAFATAREPRLHFRILAFLIPAAAFAMTAFLSGLEYVVVRTDLANITIACLVAFALGSRRMSPGRRDAFFACLHRLVGSIGIAAAIVGLIKFQLLNATGTRIPLFVLENDRYPPGSSLNNDYTVFSLALVLSWGSIAWMLRRETRLAWRLWFQIGLVLIPLAVLLTSSRRGPLLFALGVMVLAAHRLLTRKRRDRKRDRRPARSAATRYLVLAPLGVAVLAIVVAKHDFVSLQIREVTRQREYEYVMTRLESVSESAVADTRVPLLEYSLARLSRATLPELLFGGGFTYVHEMAFLSLSDEDYPHNFLLAALLYGGIAQAGLTMLMILVAVTSCFRARQEEHILLYWLLLMLVFHFSSSNSIFSMKFQLVTLLIMLVLPRREHTPRPGRTASRVLLPGTA